MSSDPSQPENDTAPPLTDGEFESPDDPILPPVEPPSAGFIVQLFLIPALIVAVILGVYLLFGQLAASEMESVMSDFVDRISARGLPAPGSSASRHSSPTKSYR